MNTLRPGYLFKKYTATYKLKRIEIFEWLDVVIASEANSIYDYTILTGEFAGEFADHIRENGNEGQYIFLDIDLKKAMNGVNAIDFFKFQKEFKEGLDNFPSYYTRKSDKTGLTKITDKNLIEHLQKTIKINVKDFDEEVFENNSDISSMYSSIKQTIISQDEQIMQILTSLFKNQKVVTSDLDIDLIAKLKENVLIYGSTGTGKTEILKRISKLYNIPIVIEDATSLSETGYAGRNVTDMLENLYLAANGDIELAQKGILVIDEFDKLAEKKSDVQSHVSREGVQRALLKLLDGSLFYFDNKKFDTSKLTVVALGAFTGIANNDDYRNLTTDDFMNYGIMRELMGRFSKTIPMNPLQKEDIIKILKNSDFSPLNTYKKLFEMLEVDFDYNENFIEYIADLSIEKKSGARSLKTVFDDCISSALFRIFAGEYSKISLVKPTSDNPKPYILSKNEDKEKSKKKR